MVKHTPLALIAADAEDLQAVSALLQDAVVKVGDIAYLPGERRFALVANRYLWESAKRGLFRRGHRVRCGVHFDDVLSVKSRAVRMDVPSAVLSLLSSEYKDEGDGGTIELALAGGGGIALEVEAINVTLKDLSEPWPAARRPDHKVD